jgi:hypothetical protein
MADGEIVRASALEWRPLGDGATSGGHSATGDACSGAWAFYVNGILKRLVTTGSDEPNPGESPTSEPSAPATRALTSGSRFSARP